MGFKYSDMEENTSEKSFFWKKAMGFINALCGDISKLGKS